ncbi:MAG: hypothetical protein DME46_01150 [Verrucomicrobia bacterium]|nr:MAG: hypothetical protein DME46_01150 [Verrucomicrobiota bacterium]
MIFGRATLCGAASAIKSAIPLDPRSLACFVVAAAVTGGKEADALLPPMVGGHRPPLQEIFFLRGAAIHGNKDFR